jgi:uncharacterized protein YraI
MGERRFFGNSFKGVGVLKSSVLLLAVVILLLACRVTDVLSAMSATATPVPTARPQPSATPLMAMAAEPPTAIPAAPAAAPTQPPQPISASITGDNLRMRAAPNTSAAIVDRLNKGDAVQVTGKNASGDWLQVFPTQKPSSRGWISAQFAQVNGSLDSIPVVEPGQSTAPSAPAVPPAQAPSQPPSQLPFMPFQPLPPQAPSQPTSQSYPAPQQQPTIPPQRAYP